MRRARFFLLTLLISTGCSPEWYRSSADEEVSAILRHEQKKVGGSDATFTIVSRPLAPASVGVVGEREDLKKTPPPTPVRVAAGAEAAPGALPTEKAPAPVVPLRATRILDQRSALELAFRNNRNLQDQKESLYLSALSLTLAQHQFAPRFFGIITGDWGRAADGSESGSVAPGFGLTQVFVNGARLSLSVAQSFFQFFTGDRRAVASTVVQGTLTQPLLRGFGTEIAREPLTQSERNVAYQARTFERFRKTLAVSVITEYYRVLEARDRVNNAYLNWQSLVTNRDRVEALADAQKRPRIEVGQARQDELRAQDDWSSSVERYEGLLDRFKITLGIPTDEEITLEQGELARLVSDSVAPLEVSVEEVIQGALVARLDLKTERDRVADSERQVNVAADALRAQLDISAQASLASDGNNTQKPFKFNGTNLAYGVGFDLDLPLDRKAERNAYVGAMIELESRRRDVSLFEDNVRLTVRDEYRRLEREIVSYQIQRASLALAEERVQSTTLFFQAGRAQTRDVLEAQAALNSARNALTSALINYSVARLELLRDAEALRIGDRGEIGALPLRKET